jgi:XTP/dITP diphosphohydrolase
MRTTVDLVFATANADKLAEFAAMLDGVAEVLPRPHSLGEIDETADSLIGNARLKAAAVAAATGLPALGDDTGLEVDALGGAPGVHSADYAGPQRSYRDNCRRLLADMDGQTDRRARFRTVLVVRWPDGRELVAEGVCEGVITTLEMGQHGFGYDSVFIPEVIPGVLKERTRLRTFAEMSMGEKNLISHRSIALRNLLTMLRGCE